MYSIQFLTTYLVISSSVYYSSQKVVLKIGAIVDNQAGRDLVNFTTQFINKHKLIGTDLTMETLSITTQSLSTFNSIRAVCNLVTEGIVAMVGTMSSTSTQAISPVTEALRIPQVTPTATNPLLGNKQNFPYLIRMSPPDSEQSKALVEVVEHFHWTNMAILTSNTDYGVNGLLQFQAMAAKKKWTIHRVHKFPVSYNISTVDATPFLKNIKATGVRVVILHCLAEFGNVVFRQARSLGMLEKGWAWLVTDGITGNPEMLTNGFESGELSGLIGTRPSFGSGNLYETFVENWRQRDKLKFRHSSDTIQAYDAYHIDAFLTLAYVLRDVHSTKGSINPESLSCKESSTAWWNEGDNIMQYFRNVSGDGVASQIQFSGDLIPKDPQFQIVNLQNSEWKQVGTWSSDDGLKLNESDDIFFMERANMVYDKVSTLRGGHIRIVTIEEAPFVMVKNKSLDPTNVLPGDLDGYLLDFLDKLVEEIGFNYTLYMVADGNFGLKDPLTRQWNGLIRDLIEKKADVGLSDIFLTHARETDVDYAAPYMDIGMTFAMKKPDLGIDNPFKFLDPFTTELWIYLMATTGIIAIMVTLINKLSPYDFHGEFTYVHKEEQERKVTEERKIDPVSYIVYRREYASAERILNFSNTVMLSIGSLLGQGGAHYPRSLSGRIILITWWMCVVIILATYTANLAAFLTKAKIQTSIDSIEDLGTQTKVSYGTVANSAGLQLFRDSQLSLYQDMYLSMKSKNKNVKNSYEGIEKARKGNYAFMWDASVLKYMAQQEPCDTLDVSDRLFGKTSYALPLQKNSPYKDELSKVIIYLRESHYMESLEHKWFNEEVECAAATDGQEDSGVLQGVMSISHMIGVFYIIYGSMALGVVVAFSEWCLSWCTRKRNKEVSHSPCHAIKGMCYKFKEDLLQDCLPRCQKQTKEIPPCSSEVELRYAPEFAPETE